MRWFKASQIVKIEHFDTGSFQSPWEYHGATPIHIDTGSYVSRIVS